MSVWYSKPPKNHLLVPNTTRMVCGREQRQLLGVFDPQLVTCKNCLALLRAEVKIL